MPAAQPRDPQVLDDVECEEGEEEEMENDDVIIDPALEGGSGDPPVPMPDSEPIMDSENAKKKNPEPLLASCAEWSM